MIDFHRFKRGLLSVYLAGAISFEQFTAIANAMMDSGAINTRQRLDLLETAGQGSLFCGVPAQEVNA